VALSTAEIKAVVADLKPRLEGGRVERVDQPGPERLILHIRNGALRHWLLVCVHGRSSRLHLLTRRPDEGSPVGGFGNVVRRHMTGAPLRTLRQMPGDRVVIIEAVERDRFQRPHPVRLVAELTGAGANLLLVDETDRILAMMRTGGGGGRGNRPGGAYTPLHAPDALPPKALVDRFSDAADPADPLALHRAIEAHYAAQEADERTARLRGELASALGTALKRARRRARNISRELAAAEDAESVRRKGELLKLALPGLHKGQRELVVEDLFDPERAQVTIELDPRASPQQNLARLFRRYKKAKAGRQTLEARADDARARLERIEALGGELERALSEDDLTGLKQRVRAAGVEFREDRAARVVRRPAGPRMFRSEDGFEIMVARSARENDRLTFTVARGNDWWMHLLAWPGPHVIVRKPPDREVTRQALLDAAHLAIHFSKIRGAEHAEVVYTQVKRVRKARGGSPGKVNYSEAATLRVRFEPERLRRLMDGGKEDA